MPENGLSPDFLHYMLPEDRIAQKPAARRDQARLLVARGNELLHRRFSGIGEFLLPGDCLVLNKTKVLPARLLGRRSTGGKVELLLIEHKGSRLWTILGKPGRALKKNSEILLGGGVTARVVEDSLKGGLRLLEFNAGSRAILNLGRVPLPPYIRRSPGRADRGRYQTVFAKSPGAVAAPTAGLHFTGALLRRLRARGIRVAEITLHVGPGTFQPVNGSPPAPEAFEVGPKACAAVNRARSRGGRVIAVGTTVAKALETAALRHLPLFPTAGRSSLFIRPPFEFRVVEGLVTNFHLPGSSLLLLVAAFAGLDGIRRAYAAALSGGYRFLSYGDASLFLPGRRRG